MDVLAHVVRVAVPVESCTQKHVELHLSQMFLISAAKSQLPLLLEDASRPEKSDVRIHTKTIFFLTTSFNISLHINIVSNQSYKSTEMKENIINFSVVNCQKYVLMRRC